MSLPKFFLPKAYSIAASTSALQIYSLNLYISIVALVFAAGIRAAIKFVWLDPPDRSLSPSPVCSVPPFPSPLS